MEISIYPRNVPITCPVRLTVLHVIDGDTARQGALSPDGKITYNVTLRKFGPSWRIDEITQVKTK